jgi:hypothetical protein
MAAMTFSRSGVVGVIASGGGIFRPHIMEVVGPVAFPAAGSTRPVNSVESFVIEKSRGGRASAAFLDRRVLAAKPPPVRNKDI